MVEAGLARRTGVKGHIRIEISPVYAQAQLLHPMERGLQMGGEIEGIVVLTSQDTGQRDDIAVPIHDGQDVTGFAFLAPLIGDGLTAFLGQTMRAIQVEFRQIQIRLDGEQAVLPDPFETTIATPARIVPVDGGITDFFFSACGDWAIGNSAHWQPVCSQYRM